MAFQGVIRSCKKYLWEGEFDFSKYPNQAISSKSQRTTDIGYDGNVMLMIKFIVVLTVPWLAEKSKMRLMDGESEDFLANVMKQAIDQRDHS